jgi:hypothetical protein
MLIEIERGMSVDPSNLRSEIASAEAKCAYYTECTPEHTNAVKELAHLKRLLERCENVLRSQGQGQKAPAS